MTADRIFLADDFGIVEQIDQTGVGGGRLAHLRGRILQVVDLGRRLRDHGLGHDERVGEPGVEPLRDVAGEFEVLTLVLPDRNQVGVVEQHVGGHAAPGR